jgi:uncharacterized protein YndB with AHSA1/START domain
MNRPLVGTLGANVKTAVFVCKFGTAFGTCGQSAHGVILAGTADPKKEGSILGINATSINWLPQRLPEGETMTSPSFHMDLSLDLVLERVVDIPSALVWMAWTTPQYLKKWFTPAPWTTTDCEIDLRPGGIFRTVMRSPEGQEFPGTGCYLEVVRNERLVWTNTLASGYRPSSRHAASSEHECAELLFTAVISLEPQGNGTKYTALAMHGDEESRKKHEAMGFHQGWGAALDQLVAVVKKM